LAQFYREPAATVSFIERWIHAELKKTEAAGCVIGLSGGIDSATAAALLRRVCGRENMLAIIMPCHNAAEDERDARLAAEVLGIQVKKIDITEAYDQLTGVIEASFGNLGRTARLEIKPRLRMATLYSVAQVKNYLVVGAGNKDELYFGDFTKYGDVGVDMLPLGDLLAGEVIEVARFLGVPETIISRPRAGSSISDQSDGGGSDVTYDDIDRFIATGNAATDAAVRIKDAYEISQHKRNPVRIPEVPR
jgi:NAD+ synthase